jgi:hypothetical protein
MKIRKLRNLADGRRADLNQSTRHSARGGPYSPRTRSCAGHKPSRAPALAAGEQVERAVIVGGILISASFLVATALNRWEKEERAPAQARPAPECAADSATQARSTEPRGAKNPCDEKAGATAAADVVKSEHPAQ